MNYLSVLIMLEDIKPMTLLFAVAQVYELYVCMCAQSEDSDDHASIAVTDCTLSGNQINLGSIPMASQNTAEEASVTATAAASTAFPGAGGSIFMDGPIHLTLINTNIIDSVAL